MSDIDDSPGEVDEYESRQIGVALGAETLRRVGMVMLYVGGFGVVAWAFETYSTWDSVNREGFPRGALSHRVALVLGHVATLLLAALVMGLGSAFRLLADWTILWLADEELEGADIDPPADT
jgi:hypothetical protein